MSESEFDRAAQIEAFWAWWPSVAAAIDEGFQGAGLAPELIAAMSERVAALHPGLDWEFGPGHDARHHLAVSSKGDGTLRFLAEQWLARAPDADAVWEFHASRQPHPGDDLKLEIGGVEVALSQTVFGVLHDEHRERLDLVVFHPVFPQLDDFELRERIAFIALDSRLGEDGVERWIGVIEIAEEAPEDAVSLGALEERVDALAAEATGERWVLLSGESDGSPVFVLMNRALKRVDYFMFDQHIEVVVPLLDPTDQGLTTSEEADDLNALEDSLLDAVDEVVIHIGRETHAGKRTLHLHAAEQGPALPMIRAWALEQGRPIEVSAARDVDWDILRRWG